MGSCESFFFGPEPDGVEGANGQITKGLRVQTQYTIAEGGDGRWYMGTVQRLYAGNKCKICYDDGDSWTGNAREVWSLNGPPPGAPPPQAMPMGVPVVQGIPVNV
ncbi:unnamed protein product [Symbiodinium pilosum]|uniref:Tudor domain-containing protein n=1 Tax=Symbiodinium pilosum TaxID=2952 RepID=A0A812XQY8_SYMPI|nr:unnamed protein product [Symbiodinium pilosum]